MSFIAKILGRSVGSVMESVGGVVDKSNLSGEEKQKLKLELGSLLQTQNAGVEESIMAELLAKKEDLKKELERGDSYTRRARPSVAYAGLIFIFFNFCLVPAIAQLAGAGSISLELPHGFWYGWTGIVATWTVGRTFEKRGARDRVTRLITGSKGGWPFDEEDVAKG